MYQVSQSLQLKADNLPFGANNALNEGALQIITMTVKIMNGLQANKTSLPLSFSVLLV